MSVCCVILGRAGSKGVPGKNLRGVAGRPCVAWTIEDALSSPWASAGRVIVSSDAPEILTVARSMGVETVSRPRELAGDLATVDAAARHAVATAGVDERLDVVVLYANVPVRPMGLIDDAIERLWATAADSCQSYTTVGKYHPWWMARLGDAGEVSPWQGAVLNHGVFRRQELPPACVPDGGVLVCRREALELRVGAADGPHAFFGLERRGVVTAEGSVVDIDTEADVARAEAVLIERTPAAERRAG